MAERAAVAAGEGRRRTTFGNRAPLSIIAGPCALESRALGLEVAETLAALGERFQIGIVFKASFDKANRTSAATGRGVGLSAALDIFAEIKARTGLPVLTDVHETAHCADVAAVVDILQIPAFLSRQTDLIVAAARTGRAVNIKKGQFLAPWDMQYAVEKARAVGNERILVTERGASFGYNMLVSDMRALPILAETTGAPVIFDATHSAQRPGGRGGASGGDLQFVPVLARAAVAVGVAGVFLETHPNPEAAVSDGATMIPLDQLPDLIETLLEFDRLAKRQTEI